MKQQAMPSYTLQDGMACCYDVNKKAFSITRFFCQRGSSGIF